MSDGDERPLFAIGDRIVSWVLGISALATLAFLGWIATSMLEVRTELGHLKDQMTGLREQRTSTADVVVDRLDYLSARVARLEDTVDRLRHPEEKR